MVSTWILLSQLNFRRMITGYYRPIETLTSYCKASLWLPAVGNKELLMINNFCTFQVTKGNLALSMRCQVGWHRSLSKVLQFSDIIPISTNFLQFANNIFFCKSSSDSFPLNSVYFCNNLMIFGSITPSNSRHTRSRSPLHGWQSVQCCHGPQGEPQLLGHQSDNPGGRTAPREAWVFAWGVQYIGIAHSLFYLMSANGYSNYHLKFWLLLNNRRRKNGRQTANNFYEMVVRIPCDSVS